MPEHVFWTDVFAGVHARAVKSPYKRQMCSLLVLAEESGPMRPDANLLVALVYNLRVAERMVQAAVPGRPWFQNLRAAQSADYHLLGRLPDGVLRVSAALEQYGLAVPDGALDFAAIATVRIMGDLSRFVLSRHVHVAGAHTDLFADQGSGDMAATIDPVAGLARAIDAVTAQLFMRAYGYAGPMSAVRAIGIGSAEHQRIVADHLSPAGAMHLVLNQLDHAFPDRVRSRPGATFVAPEWRRIRVRSGQ